MLSRLILKDSRRLYFLALLVGVISGVGALLFQVALDAASGYVLTGLAHLKIGHPEGERAIFHVEAVGDSVSWLIVILPALGGLIGGWLVYRWAPEAAGHGTDAMIDSFHNKAGHIRPIVPLIKGLATIFTLATGGSAGKEGPVAQIGGGFGSTLATKLGLGMRDRRTLLLAGTAGGLGAIFRAPLGGALTAVEVLYKEDIESEALIPCIISSVTSYITFCSLMALCFPHTVHGTVFKPIFSLPQGYHPALAEIWLFVMLGLVCSGVGWMYVRVFYGSRDHIFNRMTRVPIWLRPAIGGLFVGFLGLLAPEILSGGFGYIQKVISMDMADLSWRMVGVFVLLAVFKIFATSGTVSSGGSGGVFGPSLFIGGMLGAAVGGMGKLLFPDMVVSSMGAWVVIGMCSFFSGVANAPIAAMIMISEMTGGYELLAPLMLVSVIAIILSRNWSIYEKQVPNKFFSKAHVSDMTIDVLQEIYVKEMAPFHRQCITTPWTLLHSAEVFAHRIHSSDLVLANDKQKFEGMVSLMDVHFDSEDPLISNLVTLEDIMTTKVELLEAEQNLHEALELLLRSDFDKIPVVNSRTEKILLGYLSYNDILAKYHSTVNQRRGLVTGADI